MDRQIAAEELDVCHVRIAHTCVSSTEVVLAALGLGKGTCMSSTVHCHAESHQWSCTTQQQTSRGLNHHVEEQMPPKGLDLC